MKQRWMWMEVPTDSKRGHKSGFCMTSIKMRKMEDFQNYLLIETPKQRVDGYIDYACEWSWLDLSIDAFFRSDIHHPNIIRRKKTNHKRYMKVSVSNMNHSSTITFHFTIRKNHKVEFGHVCSYWGAFINAQRNCFLLKCLDTKSATIQICCSGRFNFALLWFAKLFSNMHFI